MFSQHDLTPSRWGNIAVRERPHHGALSAVTDHEKVSYEREVTGKVQKHSFLTLSRRYAESRRKSRFLSLVRNMGFCTVPPGSEKGD